MSYTISTRFSWDSSDLKTQNAVPLTAIYIVTLFLLVLVQWGIDEAFVFSELLLQQTYITAVITVLGAVLSNILPNTVKHILVFYRFRNVLPGHRCKEICGKDPRLSMENLKYKWPDLFGRDTEESAQNAYWYEEIYSPVKNTPEVLQAHRNFLLYRDAVSGLSILMIGLLVWQSLATLVSMPSISPWSLLLLVGLIILLAQAGRQSGIRMVTNSAAVGLTTENDLTKQ